MNLEDRMISVESSIRTLSKVATQQMLHNRETDEHLMILLGIAKGQEGDISAIKADISAVQADVSSIKGALSRMETHIDERFDAIMALLQSNQSKQ